MAVRPPVITDFDDQNQREVRTGIRQLDGATRRVVVRAVALSTTSTRVPHSLGRIPLGWQILDKNAHADVWRDTSQATTNDAIFLKASAAVTVDLQFI